MRWIACHVFGLHTWVGELHGPQRCAHCPKKRLTHLV